MSKLSITLCALVSFICLSCSDLTGDYTGADLGAKSSKLGGLDSVNVGNNKFVLAGTASNGGDSGHNYRLKFKLPEGESLKFHFFAKRDLAGGADYTFTKKLGKVNLEITLNNKKHSYELTGFQDQDVIDLDIDIHNDHTDIHMLAWNHAGSYGDSDDCTFDGSCLYNSEDFSFDVWLDVGKASGTFWGVTGDGSLILILEGPLAPRSDV